MNVLVSVHFEEGATSFRGQAHGPGLFYIAIRQVCIDHSVPKTRLSMNSGHETASRDCSMDPVGRQSMQNAGIKFLWVMTYVCSEEPECLGVVAI